MNLDEQILKRVDKQMLNQLVNENVIPFTRKNSKNPRYFNTSGVFYWTLGNLFIILYLWIFKHL